MNTLKIEHRRTDDVKPYERNPRLNDDAVDAVAASLREFGWRQPIVVDAQGVIIVGHTRWKAAKKLGWDTVPVHVATDLSAEQIRAYRIADNQTASIAEWATTTTDLKEPHARSQAAIDGERRTIGLSKRVAATAGRVAGPIEALSDVRTRGSLQAAATRRRIASLSAVAECVGAAELLDAVPRFAELAVEPPLVLTGIEGFLGTAPSGPVHGEGCAPSCSRQVVPRARGAVAVNHVPEASMSSSEDPAMAGADDRRYALAGILATGVLRLRARRGTTSERPRGQRPPDSAPCPLEVAPETSLSVHDGSRSPRRRERKGT